MAKLTPEQKAANKVIFKARDRAYSERRKAYRSAMDAALEAFKNGPEQKAADEANAAFTQAFNMAEAERRQIDDQIRALREQQEGLRTKHKVDELNAARRQTGDAQFKGRQAVEARVDSEYPDVAGVYSAVEWAAKVDWSPSGQKEPESVV